MTPTELTPHDLPPKPLRAPWRRRLLLCAAALLAGVIAFILLDAPLRQRIIGPSYDGIPLVSWQQFLAEKPGKDAEKVGWWGHAHEAFVHDKPDEQRWKRLSGKDRRDIVLSLDDKQADFVRQRIVMTLKDSPHSPEVSVRLRAFAKDQNPAIRVEAARALHQHEPTATDFVPDLLKLMEDNRGFVSHEVCGVLAKIGSRAPEAVVPPLLSRIAPDDIVSHAALVALAGIGPGAKDAVPTLLKLADSSDWKIRALAIGALGGTGTKEAAPRVIAALGDGQREVELAAVRVLPRLGAEAKPAIPILLARVDALDASAPMYHEPTELSVLGLMGENARDAIPGLLQLRIHGIERRLFIDTILSKIDSARFARPKNAKPWW